MMTIRLELTLDNILFGLFKYFRRLWIAAWNQTDSIQMQILQFI